MRGSLASLFMVAWFSMLVATIHSNTKHSQPEIFAFFAVELNCIISGLLEAGSIESGIPSKGRRVFQALVLTATVAYFIVIFVT